MKKFKLTDAQIQKGKDLIDKETIETFIIRAEENIKKGNINLAMHYLIPLVDKYPSNERVLELKQKYENTTYYIEHKEIYEKIHKCEIK